MWGGGGSFTRLNPIHTCTTVSYKKKNLHSIPHRSHAYAPRTRSQYERFIFKHMYDMFTRESESIHTPFSEDFVDLRSVHMERFAYVCKFCIYAKFAYVCKSLHVYAFTHVCKICTYAKVGKFAPASDQVQISFCVYANVAYMQI